MNEARRETLYESIKKITTKDFGSLHDSKDFKVRITPIQL